MSKRTEKTIQISKKEYENFMKLEAQNSELTKKNQQQKEEIERRDEWIKLLRQELYGQKSEKTKKPEVITDVEFNQLTIYEVMDGVSVEELENTAPGIITSEKNPDENNKDTPDSGQKMSSGRRRVAVDLPEREIILDVPEEYRKDENGEPLVFLAYEKSERLHRVPEKLERLIIKREIWGYKDSRERYIIAPPLEAIIPKGKLTDEFIHHIVFEKYFNGMPLYRQLKCLNALGADLSKSTMSDAVEGWSVLYQSVVDAIKQQIFSSRYVHADESPLKHKTEDQKYKNGYMHVYQDTQQVYFTFSQSRSQEVISNVLQTNDNESGKYIGYLMCDGYAGYNVHKGKRLACWAHARRQFFKLAANNAKAKHVVNIINKIYKVEKELAADKEQFNWSEEEFFRQRYEKRNSKSHDHIEELEKKLIEYGNNFTPQSAMGKAISYTTKRWKELQVFLEDGCLPIDNNAAERSIRSMVVGRKNYLFAGSKDGGNRAANSYTIMESCRLQGLDPRDYMRAVTPILLFHRDDPDFDYSQLTPKSICITVQMIRKMQKNL